MTKKWSDVAASAAFQSLSFDEQEEARQQYFAEVVAPQVGDDVDNARMQFDADTAIKRAPRLATAPQPAPEQPSFWGEVGNVLTSAKDYVADTLKGKPESVMDNYVAPKPATQTKIEDLGAPVTDAYYDKVRKSYASADSKTKLEMEAQPNLTGQVARGLQAKTQATPEASKLAEKRMAEAPTIGEQAAEVRLVAGEDRTIVETGGDLARDLSIGMTQLFEAPANIIAPDSEYAETLRGVRQELQEGYSEKLQARQELMRQKIAEDEGFADKFVNTLSSLVMNPSLAVSEVVKQMPNLVAMVGVARGGAVAGAGAVKLAGRASPTLAIGEAISGGALAARGAQVGATAGGMGSSVVLTAGDAAGNTYEALTNPDITPTSTWRDNPDFQRLVAGGMSEGDAIKSVAKDKAQLAGLIAAPLGVLGFMGAEASIVSRGLAGRAGTAMSGREFGRVLGKELVTEQIEEGGTQVSSNLMQRTVNPNVKLDDGVAQAMATAAVAAGGITTATNAAPLMRNFTPDDSLSAEMGLSPIVVPTVTRPRGDQDVGTDSDTGGMAADSGRPASIDLNGGMEGTGLPPLGERGGLGPLPGGVDAGAGQTQLAQPGPREQLAPLARVADRATDDDLLARVQGTLAPAEDAASAPAQPTTVMMSRGGNGYATQQDATVAMQVGQKREPDMDWKIEPIEGDRFRVAAYARAAEPALPSMPPPLPESALAAAEVRATPAGEWAAFTPDTGTLGIPRAEMPQIKAEHRGAMVNFLNARGVTHAIEEVRADTLKPTQAEFSTEKVAKARDYTGGDRSILISSDNHVLDGHHQWLAKKEAGEPVKVIRLNAPIAELLTTVKEFPSATLDNSTAQAAPQPAGATNAAPTAETTTAAPAPILPPSGKPFSTPKMADVYAKANKIADYQAVEIKGGWAIQPATPAAPEMAAPAAQAAPIVQASGEPFKTEKGAMLYAQQQGIEAPVTVSYKGGFAIAPQETTNAGPDVAAASPAVGSQTAAGTGLTQGSPEISGASPVAINGGDQSQPVAGTTEVESAPVARPADLKLAIPAPAPVAAKALKALARSGRGDAVVAAPATDAQYAASAIGRILGRTVTFFTPVANGSNPAPNAFMMPGQDANVYVATDANDAPVSLVFHEAVHGLPPALKRTLVRQLGTTFDQSKRGEFAKDFGYESEADAVVDEEIAAFITQAVSGREDFLKQFQAKLKNQEFRAAMDVVLANLKTIVKKLTGSHSYGDAFVKKYVTDVQKAVDLVSTAMAGQANAQGEQVSAVPATPAATRAATPAPSAPVVTARRNTSRERMERENPFMAFLAEKGIALEERSDLGIEPGKNRMVPGYGPLFRRAGLRLDELAQMANEAGFLTDMQMADDTDNAGVNQLSDMIQQALAGDTSVGKPAEDIGAAMDEQRDDDMIAEAQSMGIETEGKTSDEVYDLLMAAVNGRDQANADADYAAAMAELDELNDAEFKRIEQESLRNLNEELQNEHRENEGRRRGTDETAPGTAEESDRGTGGEAFELEGETPAQARLRQQIREKAARDERDADARADATEKQDRLKRDIAARQDASAEDFQLGQSAEDGLSGKKPMFSAKQKFGDRDRSNIETATRRMGKFVDAYTAGDVKDGDTQLLGPTPAVLKALGAPSLDMMIDGSTVNKILRGKHIMSMSPEILKQIPDGIYDPLLVFDSSEDGRPGKLILTEIKADNGAPVVVAIHMRKQSGRMVINEIASAYDYQNAHARLKSQADKLEYYRNEKSLKLSTTPSSLDWLDVVQKARGLGAIVITEADVVNEFGVQFSLREPSARTIEVDGVRRPIENSKGQKVGANFKEQAAFWKWFGNSKVADPSGKPLVVYHGTYTDFSAFDRMHKESERKGLKLDTVGSWFTSDTTSASKYGSTVMPAYLSMKNPLTFNGDGKQGGIKQFRAAVESEGGVEQFRAAARDEGHDGILIAGDRIDGLDGDVYITFDPEQIKSATGNNGEFDADNADIRFSNRQAPITITPANARRYQLAPETRTRAVRRNLQDYFLRVKEVQEVVASQGGTVDEQQDVYQAETLSYGRMQEQIRDFKEKVVQPLLEDVQKRGLSLSDLALYAYALHAPERNAAMQKINPALPDGTGSGMTDDEATEILAAAKAEGYEADLQALHVKLQAITKSTRDLLLREGLVNQDQYDAWIGGYQNYVPLRGFVEEETDEVEGRPVRGMSAGGKGFNIRGAESIKALGRTSMAGHVIENIVNDYERAVARAERNEVAKVLLNLVTTNPDASLWEIDTLRTTAAFSKKDQVVTYNQLIDKGEDTISVKLAGKEVYIKIKDEILLRAMKQAGKDDTGATTRILMKSLGWYTAFMRNVLTRYNPAFGAMNAVKDFGFGAVSALADLGPKGMALYSKNYMTSLGANFRAETGRENMNKAIDIQYQEFRASGATTGGWHMRDLQEMRKELSNLMVEFGAEPQTAAQKLIATRGLKQAYSGSKKIFRMLELVGALSENQARFAAYRAARELGKSPAAAGKVAKELTTNFNRKGEWGSAMNTSYLFFNAGVQGSAKMLGNLKSKKVQALMGGMVGLTTGLALMGAAVGGDDDDGEAFWDKIPQFEKERNLIIMLPPAEGLEGAERIGNKGRYLKIPVQYGLNVFTTLGYTLADLARYAANPLRGKSPGRAAINTVSSMATSFNPLGGAVDLSDPVSIGMAVAPSIADVGIQFGANVDGFGRPTSPKRSPFDKNPDSENFGPALAGTWEQRLARWMNEKSGGDEAVSGAIDLAPGTVRNLKKNMTGGTGDFISSVFVNIPTKMMSPEAEIGFRDMPVVKGFYGRVDDNIDMGLYYERRAEVLDAAEAAGRRAKMGIEFDYDEKSLGLQSLGEAAKQYTKAMTALKRAEMQLIEDVETPKAQRDLEIKEIKKEQAALARDFNAAYMGMKREVVAGGFK